MTKKIAIAGVPRAGKTTRAKTIAFGVGELRSTDALKEIGDWSKESEIAAAMFDEPTAFVMEGMGQDAMGKGALTVMREILPELQKRGVKVEGL